MRSLMPPSLKTVSSFVARLDLGEEKVDAGEKAVQLVARLRQRLADLLRQRPGERLELGRDGEAKAGDRDRALGERRRLPRRLCLPGPLGLFRDAGRIVGGNLGDQRAVGGVGDLQRCSYGSGGARYGEEVVEHRPVIERAFAACGETRDAIAPPP